MKRVLHIFGFLFLAATGVAIIATFYLLGTPSNLPEGFQNIGQIASSVANPNSELLSFLLLIDILLLVTLLVFFTINLVTFWLKVRRGSPGARLERRVTVVFGVFATLPGLLVALFSAWFFHFGLENWFDDRVRTSIKSSEIIAKKYFEEYQKSIKTDAALMSRKMSEKPLLIEIATDDIKDFARTLDVERIFLLQTDKSIVWQYAQLLNFVDHNVLSIPNLALKRAQTGEIVLLNNLEFDRDRVYALSYIPTLMKGYFLLVGRSINPEVQKHLDLTQESVDQYLNLEYNRSIIETAFTLIYISVTLLMALLAVYIGLRFAMNLVDPLTHVMRATHDLGSGNFDSRIKPLPQDPEMRQLSKIFNQMAGRIKKQHQDLTDTNMLLDERRRFIEALIDGVPVGVIAMNAKNHVIHVNYEALHMIDAAYLETIKDLPNPVQDLLHDFIQKNESSRDVQIDVPHGESQKTLRVRIVQEADEKLGLLGYIIALDDISDFITAQRMAAWSDVARRIAHEIKNPLTPIQLSADRLRRKFIQNDLIDHPKDQEIFDQCTTTIIKHVDNIKKMVNEFSDFARLPSIKKTPIDLVSSIEQSINIHKMAYDKMSFHFIKAMPEHASSTMMMGDMDFVVQVLNNIIKNAIESLQDKEDKSNQSIDTLLTGDDTHLYLYVIDNGVGIVDDKNSAQLFEPYITTKPKGTGLGLAIVKRIVKAHAGEIKILDLKNKKGDNEMNSLKQVPDFKERVDDMHDAATMVKISLPRLDNTKH